MLDGMLATNMISDNLPYAMMAAAGLVGMWTIVRMRKAARRDTRPKATTAVEQTITAADIRQMAEQLGTLLAELHETSRQIAAQIDNRYSKLDTLLAEADAKIKRLEELVQAAAQQGGTGAGRADTTPLPETADPKYRRVYELADRGHSAREIAQQIGAQPGEIELILNLRGRRKTA